MRKIISFAISALLGSPLFWDLRDADLFFAIGMRAVAQTSHRDQSEISKPKIATFELMLNAADLRLQKYDAF
jgi:hypothetical protein